MTIYATGAIGAQDLSDLANKIRAAHQEIVRAESTAVDSAMAAGDFLSESKRRLGRDWPHWLRLHCAFIARSTAYMYIELAKYRDEIEHKRNLFPNQLFSIQDARRLVAEVKAKDRPSKPTEKKSPRGLSAAAWAAATPAQRTHFLESVGLVSLLAALPKDFKFELDRRRHGGGIGGSDLETLTKTLRSAAPSTSSIFSTVLPITLRGSPA